MKKRFLIVEAGGGAPEWTRRVAERLGKTWRSPGGVTIHVNKCEECGWHFICSPSLREVVGGRHDGQSLYPRFTMNIGRFVKTFDGPPKVVFDSATNDGHPFVVFVGEIEGERTQVAVVSGPLPNQPPAELAYTQGPKAGRIEPCKHAEEDDDASGSE